MYTNGCTPVTPRNIFGLRGGVCYRRKTLNDETGALWFIGREGALGPGFRGRRPRPQLSWSDAIQRRARSARKEGLRLAAFVEAVVGGFYGLGVGGDVGVDGFVGGDHGREFFRHGGREIIGFGTIFRDVVELPLLDAFLP